MSSFSYLQLWFHVNKMQEFLIDYLHPMFRIYKGIPQQGETDGDWVHEDWKIGMKVVKDGKDLTEEYVSTQIVYSKTKPSKFDTLK